MSKIQASSSGFSGDSKLLDAKEHIVRLEAENENLRLMLYGATGWAEGEINERLTLLAAEEVR